MIDWHLFYVVGVFLELSEKVKAEYREKASTLTVLDPGKHRQKVESEQFYFCCVVLAVQYALMFAGTKTLPERSSRRRKKTKSSTFYIRLA